MQVTTDPDRLSNRLDRISAVLQIAAWSSFAAQIALAATSGLMLLSLMVAVEAYDQPALRRMAATIGALPLLSQSLS